MTLGCMANFMPVDELDDGLQDCLWLCTLQEDHEGAHVAGIYEINGQDWAARWDEDGYYEQNVEVYSLLQRESL